MSSVVLHRPNINNKYIKPSVWPLKTEEHPQQMKI